MDWSDCLNHGWNGFSGLVGFWGRFIWAIMGDEYKKRAP